MTVDAAGKGFTLPSGPATLCFDKEEFMKKDFEVDKFVMDCRKKVPLEVLKEDLDLYLKVVRSAMIELINKDYADFVNLSTNLVGMDKAINNLTTPLGQLKEEVLSVQIAMDAAIQAVEEKIKQQQEIQRKKAVLQRLMNIQHSVEKIEKLLGIQNGAEESLGQLTGPLIERVATEFNKLQFYVTRSKGHPLVDKVKPRISAITTTLQYSLEGSFLSGLDTGNTAMLRQCLRTYALIDKTQDAEELFREHVVRPHMEKVICDGFLKHHGNNVTAMFDAVLDFIPENCNVLHEITTGASGGDVVRGYDFIVNAVFPEVIQQLESKTASIFAPGNPDVFHKKYTACMDFVDKFELSCGSQASVKRLRQHLSYRNLMSKWSLPVYFQIRFQDIAGILETALESGFSKPQGDCAFGLVCTDGLWSTLCRCWDQEIILPSLTHRFFKLSLQSLSRFKVWLEEVHQEETLRKNQAATIEKPRSATPDRMMRASPSQDTTSDFARSASPRPATPAEIFSRPPLTTGQIVSLVADFEILTRKVDGLFDNEIKPRLSDLQVSNTEVFKKSLMDAVDDICELRVKFCASITEELTRQSSLCLSQVNDIPRLYRRTNKEMPSKPSTYLNGVMKPVHMFCSDYATQLGDNQQKEILSRVFGALSQQFHEVTSEVLTSTKKMEESLRRLKRSRGGDKDKEKSGGISDSDKIRTQLVIDIQNFHKEMQNLGLSPKDIEGYTGLTGLAEEAKNDMASS